MATVLIVLHSLIAVALTIAVLLQRSEGGVAAGMGGGLSMGGLLSPRGGKSFMTRLTAILATVFISSSLLLAVVVKRDSAPSSIIDKIGATGAPIQRVPPVPALDSSNPNPTEPLAAETPAAPDAVPVSPVPSVPLAE